MMSGCFSRATAPVSSLWAASLVWSASLLGPAAAPASRPTAAMVTATSVRAASDRDVVEKRINRELPREERCPAPRRLGGSGIGPGGTARRSEEHTSELQSLMRISYAVFCLKKKKNELMSETYTNSHVTNLQKT